MKNDLPTNAGIQDLMLRVYRLAKNEIEKLEAQSADFETLTLRPEVITRLIQTVLDLADRLGFTPGAADEEGTPIGAFDHLEPEEALAIKAILEKADRRRNGP